MSMSISCAELRPRVRRRPRPVGLAPVVRTVADAALPADAGRGRALLPAAPTTLLAGDGRRADRAPVPAPGRILAVLRSHFITPVIAAVWSTAPTEAGDYPARYLFTFLQNHGALSVTGSPVWYTVVGGSARYVERAAKGLTAVADVDAGARDQPRRRTASTCATTPTPSSTSTGSVMATHPHQALRHADRPDRDRARRARARSATPSTRRCCTPTRACCRAAPRAQASWNYAMPSCDAVPTAVQVSYNMNRLQRLDAPADLRRDAERRGPRRPGRGDRPDELRAPGLHDRLRSPPAGGCRS